MSAPLTTGAPGFGLDSPTFSANRKRIAFVWLKRAGSAIITMAATGGGLNQATPWSTTVADRVDWSPDSSRIAYSSPEFGSRKGISSNISTVRPDGTALVKLTDSRGGQIDNGLDSWSPDGTKIAFAS